MYKEIETMCLMPHPDNFKGRGKGVTELTENIRLHGVMSPLIVRPIEVDDKTSGMLAGQGYQVLAGHNRLKVAGILGLEKLPCLVRELSDDEALELLLIENMEREDLDPMDEAHAVRVLKRAWGSNSKVAERLIRSKDWVQLRLELFELSDEAKKAVRERKLCLGSAAVILSVPKGDDREKAEQLVLHPTFQEGALSVKQAEEVVDVEVIEPAKQRDWWESVKSGEVAKVRHALREKYGDRVADLQVRGMSYEASIELGMSRGYYVGAEDYIVGYVITENAPEMKLEGERDDMRWLDLAIRHGLSLEVICYERGKDIGVMVNHGLICEGEKALGEHDQDPWICESTGGKAVKRDLPEEGDHEEESDGRDHGEQMAMVNLQPVRRLLYLLEEDSDVNAVELQRGVNEGSFPDFDWGDDPRVDAAAEMCKWFLTLKGGSGQSEVSDPSDELFKKAIDIINGEGRASTSLLQRRLRLGYTQAARLMSALEDRGIVGPADGASPRAILVAKEEGGAE